MNTLINWIISNLRRKSRFKAALGHSADAIADALEVVMTTSYVRFYERAGLEAPWQAVSLDLAKL